MKAYLVSLDTQLGVNHQIWYEDKGSFVGCKGMEPTQKIELPDPINYNMTHWDTHSAIEYARSQ